MSVLSVILGLIASGFALWRIGRRVRFFLHLAQLEGYRAVPAASWMVRHGVDAVFRWSHVVGLLVVIGASVLSGAPWVTTMALILWPIAFASSRRYRRDRPKKPLAWTPRMRRLAAVSALLAGSILIGTWMLSPDGVVGFLLGFLLTDLLAPADVLVAGLLLEPFEAGFRRGFKRKARAHLARRPDLRIVAVTGSYGKTSVKFAMAEILSQRFHVLATPGSFNTPMGICKVINNDLRPEHQVLILEMGIRHPGDMAELCAIARPDVAVITGIGVAHLESMGSMEAIAAEKGVLVERLRPGGTAILNADDPFADGLARRTDGPVLMVSSRDHPTAALSASDVRFDATGTTFRVRDAAGHDSPLRTPLLGRHHVSNLLLALAVGQTFGLRLRTMVRAAARLRPVAHRLAVREEDGVTVLDDAFNSNPVGARNAVEVLGQFRSGRRIVVTPGMVELGPRESDENREFGRVMAQHADLVYLVGPRRTEPIRAGLLEAGFAETAIHTVQTLFEARERMAADRRLGDVVLYENDLPDQYTEA